MPEKTEAFAHSQTRENLMRAFAGRARPETATPSPPESPTRAAWR